MTIHFMDNYCTVSTKTDILEFSRSRVWGRQSIFRIDQIIRHDFPNALVSGAQYIERVDL